MTTATADVLTSCWAFADIVAMAAQSRDGSETGGILVGFDADDHAPLTVTAASGPGLAAARTPTRFRRDLEHAQAFADDAWRLEGSLWVGDWHTHPLGHPEPSDTDLAGYRAALADEALPVFLSIIVSPGDRSSKGWRTPRARAWLVSLDAVEPARLECSGR